MSGWMIFALVCIIFFLIGQIRVGVDARYDEDGPLVKVRLGCLRIKVFPRPAKQPKDKKAKKKKNVQANKPEVTAKAQQQVHISAEEKPAPAERPEQSAGQSAPEKKPSKSDKQRKKKTQKQAEQVPEKKAGKKMTPEQILDLAREFVPLALEALSSLWSRLVMDELELSITVGSSDPADAAMLYGKINAAMAALWNPLNEACHVKNGRAHVDVDFNTQSITLYAHVALSIKIDQILQLASNLGIKALRKFMKVQKQQKAREQARKAV